MNSTPFEVVHLVLQADREQPVDLLFVDLAVDVLPFGADSVGAQDLGILLGHRQAALGVGNFGVRGPQDLRD